MVRKQKDMLIMLSQIFCKRWVVQADHSMTNMAKLLFLFMNQSFYKKFLYEPFPVESNLREHLHLYLPNFCTPMPLWPKPVAAARRTSNNEDTFL
uniref:Uncharacterized protein n=1 Tax=Triticum urartu TaxID=4572 RepID=A0A8R7QKJ2_TRIUA